MADPRADAPLGGESNKFYGEHIGLVENIVNPPENMKMCVQVRVYGVFTDKTPVKDLPWAEYKLPIGARPNDGTFRPVRKGDLVWIDFPYDGDTRRPRITGSKHHNPDGDPNLPHEAWAGPDAYEHKRTGEEPTPAAHVYGEDEISTQHGVTVERNKDGSFAVYQRNSGTEICIDKEGDIIIHSEKKIYRSAKGSKTLISGDDTSFIEGSQKTTAMSGIEHDGGSGLIAGCINGLSVCHFSGSFMADVSTTVKVSK